MARIPHGIMFHHFHGNGHPVVLGSIDANQLADMIGFLGEHSRILGAREWMEKALARRLGQNEICLTFDDSLLCQMEVAVPVLEAFGHTGFFFVYSSVFEGGLERLEIYRAFRTVHFESVDLFYDRFFEIVEDSELGAAYQEGVSDFEPGEYVPEYPFYSNNDRKFRFVRDEILGHDAYTRLMDSMIEKTTSLEVLAESLWMRDADLRLLDSKGHVVGLHSYTHPTTIATLPASVQESEYSRNASHLKAVLGSEPVALSHPSNSYDETTLHILRGLGVKLGFQANMTAPGNTDLEWPREDHANVLAMMKSAAG